MSSKELGRPHPYDVAGYSTYDFIHKLAPFTTYGFLQQMFHIPGISTTSLASFPQLNALPSQGLLAWPVNPLFEIWVEAFLTPQFLNSACQKISIM